MRSVKNPLLHRYWIEFEPRAGEDHWSLWPLALGGGVTAYHLDDALQLLQRCLTQTLPDTWRNRPLPPIRRVTEDVDVRTLERGHVRPNMGVVIWRGVWFPNLCPAPR